MNNLSGRRLRGTLFAAAAFCAAISLSTAAAAETGSGWITENGRRAYLNEDGSRAVGTVEIDGTPYVFAPNGVQQVGWQDAGGKRWFYDPETGEPVFGRVQWRGAEYYVTETDGKLTERAETDEGALLADEYGVLGKNGWCAAGGNWYYADENGILAENETVIDGTPYLFDDQNALKTGLQTAADGVKRCYECSETQQPALHTGWFEADGDTYYLNENGAVQTGLLSLQGNLYDFDAEGKRQTGWQTADGNRYYFGADAAALRGLQEIDGETYFFGSDGVMQTGSITLGVPYYFDADGKRIDGWHDTENGKTYCSPLTGINVTGWQEIDGARYYFDAAGIMATGLTVINGINRKFDENGVYHPVKICLDAGHYERGNHSPVNSAYWEGDFSWKFHLLLKAELESYGIEVITTRADKDTDLGLEDRGRCSEGCDLFLSIHSNASDNYAADGPLACCTIDGKSDELGLKLANTVADVMQTNSRGSIWKRAGDKFPELDYYGVLRGATYVGTPAILLEHSYHTNYRATVWLLNDDNLKRMAAAEAKCLAEHFGMTS